MHQPRRHFSLVPSLFLAAFAAATLGCAEEAPQAPATATTAASGSGATGAGGAGGFGGSDGSGGETGTRAPVDEAFRMLTGRFDSKDQADTAPAYYAVQLQTCVVSAPELGERVLYVEQALMTKLGSPYRQRLFAIEGVAGTPSEVESRVYELTQPKAAVGLCSQDPSKTFTAADAIAREGCTVRLSWNAEAKAFVGGTNGKACASDLNGASYATSEVTLDAEGLESWDRGYDSSDVQVWGAVNGAYEFVRRTPIPE